MNEKEVEYHIKDLQQGRKNTTVMIERKRHDY